jgi:hypothetical protein
MGYAGTDTEWAEDIPEDVVAEGQKAIEAFIEEMQQYVWQEACERISVWAEIEE